jgi:hypothetical protein
VAQFSGYKNIAGCWKTTCWAGHGRPAKSRRLEKANDLSKLAKFTFANLTYEKVMEGFFKTLIGIKNSRELLAPRCLLSTPLGACQAAYVFMGLKPG